MLESGQILLSPVERGFEEFQDLCAATDGQFQLLLQDRARCYQPVFPHFTQNLAACVERWQAVGGDLWPDRRQGPRPLPPQYLARLSRTLGRLETIIRYEWAEPDKSYIFDPLSVLFTEILVYLATNLSQQTDPLDRVSRSLQKSADSLAPISEADERPSLCVSRCLRECARSIAQESAYPLFFQELLIQKLTEMFEAPLILALDRLDGNLLHAFQAAFLQHLQKINGDPPQKRAQQLRTFLNDNALVFWTHTIRHYQARTDGEQNINRLVSEVLSHVFESISRCEGIEPLDLLQTVLGDLQLLPVSPRTPIRQELRAVVAAVANAFLPEWRVRARRSMAFRNNLRRTLNSIASALPGKVHPDNRHEFSAYQPLPVRLTPEVRVPPGQQEVLSPDGQPHIDAGVVNLSRNLEGIQLQLRSSDCEETWSNRDLLIRFPSRLLVPPEQCWVWIPYHEEDGYEKWAVAMLVKPWHDQPESLYQRIGGELKFIEGQEALKACGEGLARKYQFPFQST